MPQTPDIVQATYDAASGTVRGFLQPKGYDRRIVKISFVNGPTGSVFTMWRGYVPGVDVMTTTTLGSRNSYDGSQDTGAIILYANEAATLEWAPDTGIGTVFTGTETATANLRSQWGDT